MRVSQPADHRRERSANAAGLAADLGVRKPQAGKAGGGHRLIPSSVASLLDLGSVVAEPVGLDDQAQVPPEKVDLEAGDADAGLGTRQAGTPNQPQEPSFELGIGQREGVAVEKRTEGGDAVLARPPRDLVAQRFGVDQVELVGDVDGRFEATRRDLGREVDERAGRSR